MKKIDIHAHVFPLEMKDAKMTAKKILSLYDALGIEKGVVLPFLSLKNPPGVKTAEAAREIAEAFPHRLYWFTTLSLSEMKEEEIFPFLAEEKKKGAKGVGEITDKLPISHPKVHALFDACGKLSLPLLFHLAASFEEKYGVVDETGLSDLEKVLLAHPDTLFFGHAVAFWSEISVVSPEDRSKRGKGPVTEGNLPRLMRNCKNLLCDLSAGSGSNAMMRDEAYAAKFLTEFQDRVFYGCDMDSGTEVYPLAFSEFLLNLVKKGAIPSEVYQKVTRENALRLLEK